MILIRLRTSLISGRIAKSDGQAVISSSNVSISLYYSAYYFKGCVKAKEALQRANKDANRSRFADNSLGCRAYEAIDSISQLDWRSAESVITLLKPLMKAIIKLQGEDMPTLSLVTVLTHTLRVSLEKKKASLVTDGKETTSLFAFVQTGLTELKVAIVFDYPSHFVLEAFFF